jgi:hypothetical protein
MMSLLATLTLAGGVFIASVGIIKKRKQPPLIEVLINREPKADFIVPPKRPAFLA